MKFQQNDSQIKRRVEISQWNDGFDVRIIDESATARTVVLGVNINQEDTAEKLVEIFKELGFESSYEDVF